MRRKEVGASGVARNKKSRQQTAGKSNMEIEESEEELNDGLNGVKGNVTNLETDFEIMGRASNLEPNKEVFNPNNEFVRLNLINHFVSFILCQIFL